MDRMKSPDKFQAIHEITSLTRGFMPAQIVLTANRLDLFSILSCKKLSAKELSIALETDPRATELLCNALTALGFLHKKQGTYENSPAAEEFLVKGRPYYCGDNLRHQSNLWQRWSKLEDVVKTGKPAPKIGEATHNAREFTLAMANIGQISAQQVVEGLDLHGVEKIIDIGGGPGTYAVEFVKKQPNIRAVVFDVPEVIEITKDLIQHSELKARISTLSGDCFADDLGSGYDLAFLSNVIHIFSLDENKILFKKVWPALNVKGKIVIKDFFVNENRSGPIFATEFAINMLINTEKGNTYTFDEINHAFDEAGFKFVHSFEVGQNSSVMVGEKII